MAGYIIAIAIWRYKRGWFHIEMEEKNQQNSNVSDVTNNKIKV